MDYKKNKIISKWKNYSNENEILISFTEKMQKFILESKLNFASVYVNSVLTIFDFERLVNDNSIDDKKLSKACYQIGFYFDTYKSDYEKSLLFFFKSLTIYERTNKFDLQIKALYSIALVYRKMKLFSKSLEFFKKIIKIAKLYGKKELTNAAVYNEMANIYQLQNNLIESIKYHNIALKIAEKNKNQDLIGNISNDIGNFYIFQKKYEEALHFYKISLNHTNKDDKRGIVSTKINIAYCVFKNGNVKAAIEQLEKLISLPEVKHMSEILNSIHYFLAEMYIEVNPRKANVYFHKYIDQMRKNHDKESEKRILKLQTKYELNQKEKEKEIFRKKNKEIEQVNEKLQKHQEHLRLINHILRHDLINNLTVAKSGLRLYEHSSDKKFIQEGYISLKKSLELISRMHELEHFLVHHSKLKEFSLKKIIEEVAEKYDQSKIILKGNANIWGDEAITSVFDNIIRNAFLHGNASHIDINVNKNTDSCEICISNDGESIPKEFHNEIFKQHFTRGETGNTGLGLYIVKKTMERYGGDVFVTNCNPKGVTFHLIYKCIS